ncbi:MAG: hypothetical protein DRI79_11725 [Chloroflexi bacterium]|nr:MAG: hypothetical protein DRI80_13525 [Chloroflexota bacterium]RLC85179.1 MAG: hypothetical protein DRI79_11725 [Chloroflexota bacterium]HEY67289.1 hypothetical protein [Thermoflexia bacterium]
MVKGVVVECYAGICYPERPRAFVWEEERVEVEEIERRWRTPSGPAFRVRAAGGRRFTLTYDEAADAWDVRPVQGTPEEVKWRS